MKIQTILAVLALTVASVAMADDKAAAPAPKADAAATTAAPAAAPVATTTKKATKLAKVSKHARRHGHKAAVAAPVTTETK